MSPTRMASYPTVVISANPVKTRVSRAGYNTSQGGHFNW